MTTPKLEELALDGRAVRLEPLRASDLDALWAVGAFSELWALTVADCATRDDMRRWIEDALEAAARGTALPFTTRWRASGAIVGATRFGNFEGAQRRVEIGWTWITPAHQRSIVNTEAKYLMFRHAFEALGLNRVELKTDALNRRSRAAMLRLGATEEGVLRRHAITATGRVRDSVYYSVIREEWPRVKAHIESLLERGRA